MYLNYRSCKNKVEMEGKIDYIYDKFNKKQNIQNVSDEFKKITLQIL